jgi:glycerol uptake facilitator protein
MSNCTAEFLGTFLLILFGGGVVAALVLKGTKSENAGWLTITIGWGLGVTFAIYAVGSISGAHLNPAVTLGLAFGGDFGWDKVPAYLAGQLAGAFAGACLIWVYFGPHWAATEDKELKRAIFCTSPAIRLYSNNFLNEMVGTSVLIFALNFLGADYAQGLKPIVVGGLIILIGCTLGGTTGYAINPARDLGPRLAHFFLPIAGKGGSDWAYAWVPVLGPLLGCFVGTALFKMLYKGEFQLHYWIVLLLAAIVTVISIYQTQRHGKENYAE